MVSEAYVLVVQGLALLVAGDTMPGRRQNRTYS
jgi:hypothetical protein